MNPREVRSCDIGWITEILCKCSPLVNGRERLCMALGLSSGQLSDIDRDRDKKSGTHGYLTMALNLWIENSSEPTIEILVQVLRAQEFNSTADEILKNQTEFPPNSCAADHNCPSIWFDVPDDIHMFTGRVEQMEELHKSIIGQRNKDGKTDMTVITAVSGLGGVGKTALTIHYAWAFFKVFYTNVIWINSETKNTISDSFNRLARKLGQNTLLDIYDVVSGIYEKFGKANTLIIFDNVECYEDVKSFIPIRTPIAMRPYVLFTSRCRNWNFRTHLIDLNVFRTEEYIEFFKSYLCLTTDEELEQVEIISEALQNLPLAIRQAGAYIKVQHQENRKPLVEGLKTYMELFKYNSIVIMKFDYYLHTADIYEKTIFSTWTVSMEKLTEQNRLTRTIVELTSYLNPENIPIKLFYNIPQGGIINRVFKQTYVHTTEVNAAVKLLTDFSLVRQIDLESISVHRLLQKVVRIQVQQKYKNSQFDWIIDLIKIPLQLNNYDHYEDICLLHALSIRDNIPPYRLNKTRIKSFLELIQSKQNNSVSNNIKSLQYLLGKDKFDDAFESYEKSRKLYLAHGTSMKKPVDQIFTLRFLNLICLEILKDSNSDGINTRALGLSQIIKNVFSGSNIFLNDEATTEDSKILGKTEFMLYKTATILRSEKLWKSRRAIFCSVCFTLVIGVPNMDFNFELDTCIAMFDCLVEMQAFVEIKRFLESLSILLERILSKQSESDELSQFQNAVYKFFKKLNGLDLSTTEPELFVPLSNLRCAIYNFYKHRNNYYQTLLCGWNLIECQVEMNSPSQVLETVADLQNFLSNSVNQSAHRVYLIESDIEAVNNVHKVSQHPNCNSIKEELTVIAFDMYNLILVGRKLTNFDRVWYRMALVMLECSTQTGGLFVTTIITAVQYSLNHTATIENDYVMTYIFKFADDILKSAESAVCTRTYHVLFEEYFTYIKFIYNFCMHMPFKVKCKRITCKFISYLYAQKRYEDIITLLRDYDSYLESVNPREGAARRCNVSVANKIMLLVEQVQDIEREKQLSLLAYSIYNRVHTLNSTIHESKISMHFRYSTAIGHANIMVCLAKLNKFDELFNFLVACEKFLKKENSVRHYREIEQANLIIQISKQPICSEVRDQLILKALNIYRLGYTEFYFCVDTISKILDTLAELNKVNELIEVIRPIEHSIQKRYYPLQSLNKLALIIYKIAHHENLKLIREELLGKSLVFYRTYFQKHIIHIDKIKKTNCDSPVHIYYSRLTQGVGGIMNCLVELDQTLEIEEYIKEIVNISQECSDTNLEFEFYTDIAFCGLIEQLLSIGRESNTVSAKNKLIKLALNLCMIKYEFEKRTFSFSHMLPTIRSIVECFIHFNNIADILALSVEFQKVVQGHFEENIVEQIKKMAILSEILMTKGRDTNRLIKYSDLISESLAISKKWYEIAVRENEGEDLLSLIHFHCIIICEHLLKPNVDKLLQYSQNLYKIVEKNKDNPQYAAILVQGAIELRHAGKFDKAVEYFQFSFKILSETGMTCLYDKTDSSGDIDELNRRVRDDDSFQRMTTGLKLYMGGDTSESYILESGTSEFESLESTMLEFDSESETSEFDISETTMNTMKECDSDSDD